MERIIYLHNLLFFNKSNLNLGMTYNEFYCPRTWVKTEITCQVESNTQNLSEKSWRKLNFPSKLHPQSKLRIQMNHKYISCWQASGCFLERLECTDRVYVRIWEDIFFFIIRRNKGMIMSCWFLTLCHNAKGWKKLKSKKQRWGKEKAACPSLKWYQLLFQLPWIKRMHCTQHSA